LVESFLDVLLHLPSLLPSWSTCTDVI
jgi:hypothetical protein